ncbi:lytic transglycosylase domain-containing protein [Desulfatirhabdium butyrativorans]|uniref:lytic transglycosylase domain-containing protein n=1 Tax=Desulfatirhabdium butyrativorans TaxID=340467 RepID=UPI0004040FB7|nr:lytic transglycosylase domain-containing protein [Desulfatirhabdium butyrativorans]
MNTAAIRIGLWLWVALAIAFSPVQGPCIDQPIQPSGDPCIQRLLDGVRAAGDRLDFCGEPVPLAQTDIRERFEREMLIMLGDPAQVLLWLKRSARFSPDIEAALSQRGMPQDLKFIPVIESAFLPNAGSSKGAIGHWQFIAETGKRHGLAVNAAIDERRNPQSATFAALDYLSDLYSQFQSWTLAAAAYNMGEEGLRTEIFLQDCRDYYQLDLPKETQRYVFRIIAAKTILSHPEKFGFNLGPKDLYPPWAVRTVSLELRESTPVLLIARAANTTFKRIRDLNPQIRGRLLQPGPLSLDIPLEGTDGFEQRFESLVQSRTNAGEKGAHIVQKGDSLSLIAAKYNIPLKALLMLNRMDAKKNLQPGDRILISPDAIP